MNHNPRFLLHFFLTTFISIGLTSFSEAQVSDAAAFAQAAPALLHAAEQAPKQKNADTMVLLDEEHDVIEPDGRVRQTTHLIYRVDTQTGVENWASVTAYYWPWYQLPPKVRARVITPDGIQHDLESQSLSDYLVREKDDNVYSDLHVVDAPLPAVSIGSVVEIETLTEDKVPFFRGTWSGSYVFGRNQPVLRTRLTVDVPAPLSLQYKVLGTPELKIQKNETNGNTSYIFECGKTEPLESLSMLPPDVARAPGVVFTTAKSWAELARLYNNQVEAQIRPDEVRAFTNGLRGDEKSKVNQLLAKLHESVRYTGLELGESSLTPQPPSETLKRKFGDCKDKATLLVSMLRAAGIPADLALLNSGSGHDVDPDVPRLTRFNHAIVYLPSLNQFIDATARYSRIGELPSEDQNRWALLISNTTTELKKIPQLPSSANRTVEKREFFLQSYGPARVVETTTWYGDRESSYRSSYSGGESKEYKKSLDEYAQNEYLAENVSKYEHSQVSNLQEPFTLKLEVPKAKRGNTGLTDAVVAIRLADMISAQIPNELKKEEKKTDAGSSEESDKSSKPRTQDWYLDEVTQSEWNYRVIPPVGFHVRALPESKTINFGPAILTQEFRKNSDQSVEANIRFDLAKRTYSVAEVSELQKALKQFREKGVLFIQFDLNGNTLSGQGKVREAFTEYRNLIANQPKEAINHSRLARAFLSASLGEMARIEAREAVKLDPKSAVAYDTLGWVLLHDGVGRKYARGFDPIGAAAAYRKAKELDPKESSYALSLGEALEYDVRGERYVGVNLNEAVSVYRELRKNEDANADSVNEHLMFVLAYSKRFKELRELLSELGDTALTREMKVLAAAGIEGSEGALAKAAELAKDEKAKSDALAQAGTLAFRIRMYPEASVLLAAGADGQANASAMSNLAQIIKRTTAHEDLKRIDGDPVTLALRAMALSIHQEKRAEIESMMSRAFGELGSNYRDDNIKRHWTTRYPSDLPQNVYMDLTLALLKSSVEGDDGSGYRLTLQASGASIHHVFVVKEDGQLKLLGTSEDFAPIGQEVLDRVGRNDLKGAKTLLDWAREDLKRGGGDDPYSGSWFARVWNKSDDANPESMRLAAMVLIAFVPDSLKPYLSELEAAQAKATTESQREKYNEVLALAYQNARQWSKLEQLTGAMLSKASSSVLFEMVTDAQRNQKKWSELAKLIEEQRSKLDNDYAIAIAEARSQLAQGEAAKAAQILRTLIDRGKGNASAVNLYGWSALIARDVKPDTLDMVQQTVQQPKNQNYAILHTLGCMYAFAGRPAQAQQVLLDAMKHDTSPDEPDSSIWYGFGLLADSYGEHAAAAKLYAMVEKPKYGEPEEDSTYALAQQRLKATIQPGS